MHIYSGQRCFSIYHRQRSTPLPYRGSNLGAYGNIYPSNVAAPAQHDDKVIPSYSFESGGIFQKEVLDRLGQGRHLVYRAGRLLTKQTAGYDYLLDI